MQDFSLPQGDVKPGKSLLPDVLDGFARLQARSQFHVNERAKISAELFLRAIVSCTQALDVGVIKGVEVANSVALEVVSGGRFRGPVSVLVVPNVSGAFVRCNGGQLAGWGARLALERLELL